jgi:hypothetical protein
MTITRQKIRKQAVTKSKLPENIPGAEASTFLRYKMLKPPSTKRTYR